MKKVLLFCLFVLSISVLYGIDDQDPHYLQLLKIDPVTAATESVGPRYECEVIGFKTGVDLKNRLLYVITWNSTIPFLNALSLDDGTRKVYARLDFTRKKLIEIEGMHFNQKTGNIILLISYFDVHTIQQKQQRSIYIMDNEGKFTEKLLFGEYLNMTHVECDQVSGCPSTFDYDTRNVYANYRLTNTRNQYVLGWNVDTGEEVLNLYNNVDLSTLEYDEKNKEIVGIGYDTQKEACYTAMYKFNEKSTLIEKKTNLDMFYFITPEVSAISAKFRHYYVQGSDHIFSPDDHLLQIDLDSGKVLNDPECYFAANKGKPNYLHKCVHVLQVYDL